MDAVGRVTRQRSSSGTHAYYEDTMGQLRVPQHEPISYRGQLKKRTFQQTNFSENPESNGDQ